MNAFEVTATCNRPETQASRTPPALACLSAPPRSVSRRSGCLDRTSQKPTVTPGNHSLPRRLGGCGGVFDGSRCRMWKMAVEMQKHKLTMRA